MTADPIVQRRRSVTGQLAAVIVLAFIVALPSTAGFDPVGDFISMLGINLVAFMAGQRSREP